MKNILINLLRKSYQDHFTRYLVISLMILGVILLFIGQETSKPIVREGREEVLDVHFFYLGGCEHCYEQVPFNKKLASVYPSIHFVYHDITQPEESDLFSEMLANLGRTRKRLQPVPVTIFGERVFEGWKSEETTGKEIEKALQQCLAGNCSEAGSQQTKNKVTLPIFGEIDPSDYSLPALAVMLGLVDGFNPCAMWVLVYLISLVATLNDKKKMWLIVGSFVFASGVLYFLFMTAWLNVFLLIGYSRPLTILIGLIALGAGILNIREFLITKGVIVCKVVPDKSRGKTMGRVQKIISSPLTLATVGGIIVLAFVVNSIEFVCSSALPAIFTYALSLSNLSALQYYGYILLYDLFFMLDDLIIFGSAALALTSSLGQRYAKYAKPVGGVILLALGALLLFAPNLLR